MAEMYTDGSMLCQGRRTGQQGRDDWVCNCAQHHWYARLQPAACLDMAPIISVYTHVPSLPVLQAPIRTLACVAGADKDAAAPPPAAAGAAPSSPPKAPSHTCLQN